MEGREIEKYTGRDTKMLLDTDRNKNIDLIGKKVSIFCRTHIAVGHKIQGGKNGRELQEDMTEGKNEGTMRKRRAWRVEYEPIEEKKGAGKEREEEV